MATLPLMRSAELYLTRAYILADKGQSGAAVQDLNVVRARADLAPYAGPMDKESLKRAIEIERMKEMAFEGDRLWFLQAIHKDIPPADRALDALPWQQPRVPVPEAEVNRNPNI